MVIVFGVIYYLSVGVFLYLNSEKVAFCDVDWRGYTIIGCTFITWGSCGDMKH